MQTFFLITMALFGISVQAFSPLNYCQEKWRDTYDWWQEYKKEAIGGQRYTIADDVTTISINGNRGSIQVLGTPHQHIVIDAVKYGPIDQLHSTAVHYQVHNREAKIVTKQNQDSAVAVDCIIQVPENKTLKVVLEQGDIKTKNIKGAQKIIAQDGDFVISNASNSVEAKAPNGKGTLRQAALPADASIFVETLMGIEMSLSSKINGSLYARTLHGKIETAPSCYVTLNSLTTQLNKDFWERIKKDVKATIGSGGAPITLEVTKGNIVLDEL